jgi:hypothetical protein
MRQAKRIEQKKTKTVRRSTYPLLGVSWIMEGGIDHTREILQSSKTASHREQAVQMLFLSRLSSHLNIILSRNFL